MEKRRMMKRRDNLNEGVGFISELERKGGVLSDLSMVKEGGEYNATVSHFGIGQQFLDKEM